MPPSVSSRQANSTKLINRRAYLLETMMVIKNVADPALPHTDFPKKRNKAHVKVPRVSYFINFVGLYWPGGLMANMLILLDGFS